MTRPKHEYEAALALVDAGLNDCEISRRLGIPRRTVLDWRHGRRTGRIRTSECPICDGSRLDAPAYCYLLGLYLGDGSIATHPRAYKLRIVLDKRYPGIIEECGRAMNCVLSSTRDRVGHVSCEGCIEVYSLWKHWLCVFPQHGPGKKHEREIRLLNWQRDLTSAHPGMLLRGLIHSDGTRFLNPVWGKGRKKRYVYPRYQFTNVSGDIRRIFCEACDDFGVQWRQSSWRTISVSRKGEVARLDRIVGPKK